MKVFRNGIDAKWFLFLVGIVTITGYAVASTNPTISNTVSYFDTLNVLGAGNNYFAGNVGIGTTTPSSKLEVNGSIKVNSEHFRLGQNNYGIVFKNTVGADSMWLLEDNANRFLLGAIGSNDVVINNSNTGIGTASPNYKLEVAGTAAITGVSSNTGESACFVAATKELVRNAGVSNTCAPSAEKYKNIHSTFNDSTVPNKFTQLHPIIFDYKSDVKHLEKFGFNANEIAIQYPQIVTTHYEGNGTFVKLVLNITNPNKADSIQYSDGTIAPIEGINYEMLSAILVNQVQDQQFQLDTQSSQIRKICSNNPLLCS